MARIVVVGTSPLLADGVALGHGAFLAYVVVGGLVALRWPRTLPLHVAAALWGLLVIAASVRCPLTVAEDRLRVLGGEVPLPGGFIDLGESTEEAARRETMEEIGLDVTIDGLVGVYSRATDRVMLVVYRATTNGDAPQTTDEAPTIQAFDPDAGLVQRVEEVRLDAGRLPLLGFGRPLRPVSRRDRLGTEDAAVLPGLGELAVPPIVVLDGL